jgi:hypothetical protein
MVPLQLTSNNLWVAQCSRGCLMFHVAGGALVWRDNLANVIAGNLMLERRKIGSVNSDSVERYARMGTADGGDVGTWRLGFWGQ